MNSQWSQCFSSSTASYFTMNADPIAVVQECAAKSWADEMTFPEVVGKLIEVGVERYHADYTRGEFTYYWPDGASTVVSADHLKHATGIEFDREAIVAAIRQSQRGEHTFADFVRKTTAAGCVGYFVQIHGRRAIYFGRNGDEHVELFPSAT
ncbi:MAG: DUF1398 domain-containing protein [Pirellula sp.]|nr:DUF1398 domain-containing protein [Pirellula sp.]